MDHLPPPSNPAGAPVDPTSTSTSIPAVAPDVAPDAAPAPGPPAQPWWTRTPVLLGIGAVALIGALGFSLVSGDDDADDASRPDTSAPDAPGGETTAATTPGVATDGRLVDVEAFEPTWLFRDPNRALGDGGLGLATATWLLDDRVVVVSADIVRAHSLDDGSLLWEVPLEGEPCMAVSDLPPDSPTIVIGVAEPDSLCSRLQALDVETGDTEWTTAVEEFDTNMIERVVAAPVGLFVLDSDGVTIRNLETGRVRRLFSDDELGAKASGNAADEPFFAADHAALHAEAGVVVVTGAVLRFGPDDAEPTFAAGFDAESGQLLWMTQVSPDRLDAIPQAHDPRFLVLGTDPGEVVQLDLEAGTVASRYPVPTQTGLGRPVYEQYAHLGAPWYRTGTVPVDDDLVMVYEQVSTDRGASDDNLVRIDGETGEEVWRVGVDDLPETTEGESASLMLTAGPMVDDDHLLALAWNHRRSWIVLVDAATGEVASMIEQPEEITNSYIQGQPALHVLDGDRLLMVYNPNGGHNRVEDAAITGDDRTSVILLSPAE